jgi:hypothetical protein
MILETVSHYQKWYTFHDLKVPKLNLQAAPEAAPRSNLLMTVSNPPIFCFCLHCCQQTQELDMLKEQERPALLVWVALWWRYPRGMQRMLKVHDHTGICLS